MSVAGELREIVERLAPPAAAEWLIEELRHARDSTRFGSAFAGAARRLGTTPIGDAAARLSIPWATTSGVDECGRAALVLAACDGIDNAQDAMDVVSLVRGLLRRGEVRERQAVLRVLVALPVARTVVETAIDACRTNVVTVFEAIACDNAYPARHFPDAAYFQMVLKALFLEVPVARIVGRVQRTTDELVRMVDAFASERRAAGRPVPDDVELIRRKS